jgi:hypothetical protein
LEDRLVTETGCAKLARSDRTPVTIYGKVRDLTKSNFTTEQQLNHSNDRRKRPHALCYLKNRQQGPQFPPTIRSQRWLTLVIVLWEFEILSLE